MSTDFYDRTGPWVCAGHVTERDRLRAAFVSRVGTAGTVSAVSTVAGGDVLDLGTGGGGTAAALADLGHDVLAVDLSRVRVAMARRHCRRPRRGRLVVLWADMDTFAPERRFDAVTYWSGFGTGPDAGHGRLLARIRQWLLDDGVLLIDVFDPTWWRRRAGHLREEDGFGQRIDYDALSGRLIDERWTAVRPADRVREEIRCYSESQFRGLAERAGLAVVDRRPSLGSPDPPSNLFLLRRG